MLTGLSTIKMADSVSHRGEPYISVPKEGIEPQTPYRVRVKDIRHGKVGEVIAIPTLSPKSKTATVYLPKGTGGFERGEIVAYGLIRSVVDERWLMSDVSEPMPEGERWPRPSTTSTPPSTPSEGRRPSARSRGGSSEASRKSPI